MSLWYGPMTWLLSLLATTWGRRVLYLLGSLSMLGLGVAIGRYATPPKVVTKTETKVIRVKDRNVTRTTHTTIQPTLTGPRTETTTTTVAVERATTATEAHVLTTTDRRPDWRVGVLGGALIVPGTAPSWLVGAQVERRILGPVSLTLMGLGGPKGGVAAAGLTVEF